MRTIFARLLVCGAVLAATLAAGVSPASATSPWYRVSSVSRPGDLHAGAAQDEVQEVRVTGSFIFALEEPRTQTHLVLPVTATAGQVQAGLETLYGAGNVAVSEVQHRTFRVTFQGGRGDQALPLMIEPLEGQAKVSEVVKGAADGQVVLAVANLGDASANGEANPVSIAVSLPAGLTAVSIQGISGQGIGGQIGAVECDVASLTCSFAHALPSYEQIEVRVGVLVDESQASSSESYQATVSGGGASTVRYSHRIAVGSSTAFGVEDFGVSPENEGGTVDAQAGSHPFQTTFTFALSQILNEDAEPEPAGALPKDLSFKLPPGLLGNPTAYPRCTQTAFDTFTNENANLCPADSVVGVAMVTFNDPQIAGFNTATLPIFNLVPRVGEPARFGFQPSGVPVFIGTSVRTGEDYGVTAHVENITELISFMASSVTFWGVPGDPRHASARGYGCLARLAGVEKPSPCEPASSSSAPPFFVLPTSCTGPLQTSVLVDSWLEPHKVLSYDAEDFGTPMPALDGCGLLAFSSEVRVAPDVRSASTPTGLTADVHVPQEEALNADGLAPSDVKNITVALPEGLQLNPSAADGLAACTQEQVGLSSPAESSCPDASKIATATITTPLLPDPLKGFVYLASPQNFRSAANPLENPFGSLVAMYLVAQDPVSGTRVKLPGSVKLSATGQITTTFADNPQLPFEDAEISFFGGERAPLATPARCGSYTTNAAFEPWSNTSAHEEVLPSSATFAITSGAHGAPCASVPLSFNPSLASETTDINAGGFTPLSTTLSREDGQQPLQSVTLHYPPGVSGMLAGIPLCPEAEANAGTCPAASQIGETIVSVGVGGDPFSVTGGKVYLTEKYQGAPFGLSIVNPAKAGPFDLQEGRPVVVRAKIDIDPTTAALTITTGAIPTVIEGFPLQIQHVNVAITRPGFTFNPTNCTPMSITGAITGSEGATSPVSVPFQVANCANLKFAPKFTVTTSGKTTKAEGASLTAELSYPAGFQGIQANIAKVKVDLPKQLPSRLTTLQKACANAQFEANPANCPSASKIGFAKVTTPLLPVPLEGPAIFVSHGGEAFPSLTIVLQGYGITVDLVGTTFISKAGITSTTFKTVPDVPFNTFTLTLPQGKFSALAANGNLCTSKLAMPTEFLAQNGLKINESTKIGVTGCAKKKTLTRAQKLQAALKACHKKTNKANRSGCEKAARKKLGPVKSRKKK